MDASEENKVSDVTLEEVPMQPDKPGEASPKPTDKSELKRPDFGEISARRAFIITLAAIFFAEILAMNVIYQFPSAPYWLNALIDETIMIVIIYPIVYFLLFRPLLIQLNERKRGEALISKVLENLPVGVWITDQNGQITHGNPASQKIWEGARYVGMQGYGEYKGWWLESGKQIEAGEWAAARAINRGETSLNEEIEIECFDGTHKVILNSALPILDDGEAIQGVIIVNEDITDRKRAEQALAQREALFRTAFEVLPIGVWITDSDGKINYGNPAGQQIWAGAKYVGIEQFGEYKGWWVNNGKPIEPEDWAVARAIKYGETSLNEEIEIECFDGSHKIILNSAIPIRSDQGQSTGVFVVNQDITGRKRAEEKLARQNQELLALSIAEHNQRRLAEGMAQATLALNESLDLETVLDQIFEQAKRIIPFTGANIGLIMENFMVTTRNWGFEDQPQAIEATQQRFEIKDFPILQEIASSHKPVLIEDTTQEKDWVFVPGLEWIRSDLIVPLVLEGQMIGVVNMVHERPRAFSPDVVERIMVFTTPAAVAIHRARLYATEQRSRQVAEILSAASLALTKSLDIEVVLNNIMEHTQNLVPYDVGGLALIADGSRMILRAVRGSTDWPTPTELLNRVFDSQEWPHIQAVLETRQAFLLPDTLEFPGWKSFFGPQVRNWLAIPIVFNENIVGILMMAKTKTRFFTQEHIQWAEALVSHASVAIQNAWLFEQVRSSSERLQSLARKLVEIQENERYHIASELHDDAAQALSVLKLNLGRLEQDPECPQHMRQKLENLKDVTDGVLEDLHRLAMDLRPVVLDRLGLVAALEQHAKNLNSDRLAIQFKAVGFKGSRLPQYVEISLYRIVQEALTNVVRHAQASNVGILLERGEGKVKIFVEDDGIGLDTSLPDSGDSLGLIGIRERAEMLAGSLTVESSPEKGTTIIVEVPDVNSDSDR